MEKLNDNCRRIHLQKSNKWDAAKDVLLAEERLGELSTLERTPRNYKKKLEEYWSGGISANRSKRPRLCNTEAVLDETEESEDPSSLTPEIIKSRLKDMGIKTRVRKLSRLLDIYNIAKQTQSH